MRHRCQWRGSRATNIHGLHTHSAAAWTDGINEARAVCGGAHILRSIQHDARRTPSSWPSKLMHDVQESNISPFPKTHCFGRHTVHRMLAITMTESADCRVLARTRLQLSHHTISSQMHSCNEDHSRVLTLLVVHNAVCRNCTLHAKHDRERRFNEVQLALPSLLECTAVFKSTANALRALLSAEWSTRPSLALQLFAFQRMSDHEGLSITTEYCSSIKWRS